MINLASISSLLPICLALTPLPPSISPYSPPNPAAFNEHVTSACTAALNAWGTASEGRNGEIDFPALLCGLGQAGSKQVFDDFDNVNELESNAAFVVNMCGRTGTLGRPETYVVFPDLKELEISSGEWAGDMYKKVTSTTIEQVADKYVEGGWVKPWGTAIAKIVSKSSLGDTGCLPDLNKAPEPELKIFVQPGNGGPVEDWINVANIRETAKLSKSNCVVVNGALDKVRGGYYPGVFFPALEKVAKAFYRKEEDWDGIFVLKKLSEKGRFGWLYRVYPGEWTVYEQVATRGGNGGVEVKDVLKWSGKERPEIMEAIGHLLT